MALVPSADLTADVIVIRNSFHMPPETSLSAETWENFTAGISRHWLDDDGGSIGKDFRYAIHNLGRVVANPDDGVRA